MTNLSNYLNRTFSRLTVTFALAALGALASPSYASGNMHRVDMVQEGIDLAPIYVNSNTSGYTGSEDKPHKYMVRAHASAKGSNRVWHVSIYTPGRATFFVQDVGKSEGWPIYSKSHEFHAKPGSLDWLITPKQSCDGKLKEQVAAGKKRENVLRNGLKTTGVAYINFGAKADSKSNNKKHKHKSSDGMIQHGFKMMYKVPVVCRPTL